MQQLERAEKFDENRMRAAGRHAPVLDVSIETNKRLPPRLSPALHDSMLAITTVYSVHPQP